MKRHGNDRKILCVLGIVLYTHAIMADSFQTSFQECMTNQGVRYLQSVTNLYQVSTAKQTLSRLASSEGESLKTQRQAQILMARMDSPEVFNEFLKWITDLRKRSEVVSCRGAYFSGYILKFTKMGPESEYVWETGERHLTQHGWESEERKVKKYTDEDVKNGKARNAAERLAIVEYYLKFSDTRQPAASATLAAGWRVRLLRNVERNSRMAKGRGFLPAQSWASQRKDQRIDM